MSRPKLRRGGRVTPKGTRPHNWVDKSPSPGRAPHDDADPTGFADEIRRAIDAGHPLALLEFASTLAEITDGDRQPDRTWLSNPEPETSLSSADLVHTLVGIPLPETTALLYALGPFLDETTSDIARSEVNQRRDHILPAWVRQIAGATVGEVWEQRHLLGDGENLLIGLQWPSGHEASVVIYIDHNMGTLVKDAFALPEPAQRVLSIYEREAPPHSHQRPLDAGTARARVEAALATFAMTIPRAESETWPACRPIVRWVTSMLPGGVSLPELEEPTEAETQAVIDEFLGSPEAAELAGDPDTVSLTENLLWFGQGYGNTDPWRWSEVRVEILLMDWFPRKVVADVDYLEKLPGVLQAFVRFAHRVVGVPDDLTKETLEAVERLTPEYLEVISDTERDVGPAALARALLAASGELDDTWADRVAWELGGHDKLAALHSEPWGPEPVDWDLVPEDLHNRVREISELVDHVCGEVLDHEYATMAHRTLTRISQRSPEALHRRSSSAGWAAGILIALGKDSYAFSTGSGGLTQKMVLEAAGVKSLNNKDLTVRRAAGMDDNRRDQMLLHSSYRKRLAEMAKWED